MNLNYFFSLGVFLFSNWAFATVEITFPAFSANVELETPIPLNFTVKKVKVTGSTLPRGKSVDFVIDVDDFGLFNLPEFKMSCPNFSRCNHISVTFSFLDAQGRELSSISKEYEGQTHVNNFYRWHFDETVLQFLPETRIQFASPEGHPRINFWTHIRKILRGTKYENIDKYEWAIYTDASRSLRHHDRGLAYGENISPKIDCPEYPGNTYEDRTCILFNNPQQASKDIFAEFVFFEGGKIWARKPVDRWDINFVRVGGISLVLFEKGTSRPVVKFLVDYGRIWHRPSAARVVFTKQSYDSPYSGRQRMTEY